MERFRAAFPTRYDLVRRKLRDAINLRKFFVEGIWMGALPEFHHDFQSLLWRQFPIRFSVGSVSFLKTMKYAENFLHKT